MLCNLVLLTLSILALLVVIFGLRFESLLEDIKGSLLGIRDVWRVCRSNCKLFHHRFDLFRSNFCHFWSRFFFATLLLLLLFLLLFFFSFLFLFLRLLFLFFFLCRRLLLLLLLFGLFLFLLFDELGE